MTWSVIEGDEKPDYYREENDDRTGGILCWDDAPVVLPCRPFFASWTPPGGGRRHAALIPFENGWTADLDLGDRLTVVGENTRALRERQALEEAGAVRMLVGDEWDFSYDKTGYQNPGAYVQWSFYEDDLDDGDLGLSVLDPDALRSALRRIAEMPSDPDEAARQAWVDVFGDDHSS